MSKHDRQAQHRGTDLDSNIELDGATANYGDGDDLHDVISDLDDRIDAQDTTIGNIDTRVSSGTATIVSGTTSIAVTHGVGSTPVNTDISILPISSTTNDPGNFWVSSIGSTTFTINVRSDPGASGAIFAWRVDR